MPKVKINKNKCKGCYLCVAYCPKGMLEQDNQLNVLGIQAVLFKKGKDNQCTGCGFCALICPECGIEVEK
ncbi:MAG: 4Fe-4S binding protein [Candidatus Omnitrophota bacterium]|nr:4Fe-4S binding protein [Candidatus Omnitrophota bacterium]